jgi:tetratricopeptide (TPR) repeat protein
MDSPARRLIIPFLLAASMTRVALGQTPSRDSLGAARDLYASARYDEALAVLNDMRPADAPGAGAIDLKSIEQYRSLCLLALGRGSEAEAAIAAVVTADPAYQPGDAEASPRVRAAFSDVRKRLLPEIASTRYAEAKALFDRKEFARAATQFRQVLALLDDPDMGRRNSDMKTLAAGFLDLAVAATPPPEPPKPATPAPAPPPTAPQVDRSRVYSIGDPDVVPPVILRQDIPRLAPIMKAQAKDHGVVEVVVDELGRVTAIAVRQSVQPMYDAELLTKGREWRYQPAMLNGQPVKYRKLIQLNVNKDPQ